MRAFHAIGAAFLMAWAIPTGSHANGTTPTTVSQAPAPGCHCPRVQRHGLSHWRLAKGVQQEVRRSLPNGAQSASLPHAH